MNNIEKAVQKISDEVSEGDMKARIIGEMIKRKLLTSEENAEAVLGENRDISTFLDKLTDTAQKIYKGSFKDKENLLELLLGDYTTDFSLYTDKLPSDTKEYLTLQKGKAVAIPEDIVTVLLCAYMGIKAVSQSDAETLTPPMPEPKRKPVPRFRRVSLD